MPPHKHVFLVGVACWDPVRCNVGATTWFGNKDLLMRYTNFRHPPSLPFTDIRVHIKAPLNRNWYPRSGVVEGLWIYDAAHAQYTRPHLLDRGCHLPTRVCKIVSPSSASTSFDPLCDVGTMSGVSHPNSGEPYIGSTTNE
jgi:hypothetical protein